MHQCMLVTNVGYKCWLQMLVTNVGYECVLAANNLSNKDVLRYNVLVSHQYSLNTRLRGPVL